MAEGRVSSEPSLAVEVPRERADQIRARMLDLISRVFRWMILPAVVFVVLLEVLGGRGSPGILVFLVLASAFAWWVGPANGEFSRRRVLVVLVGFFALVVVSVATFGPVLGAAPGIAAVVGGAAIFLGRRGFIACLLAIPLVSLGLDGSMRWGFVPFPDHTRGDAAEAVNWLRMIVSLVISMGAIGGLLAYVLDRFEQTIERTMLAMESGRVERAARARAQEALAQSQRMEAVGRLAGGVAHDFNNALVVILGAAEMLRKDLPPDSVEAELSADLVGAARNATEITRQLLTLGRRDLSRARSVDIDGAVHQVARAVARLVPDGVEVRVEAASGVRSWIDPTQLDQVLVNLCMNARDAMSEGGELSLGVTPLPAEELVRIEVSDSGHGMDEPTRARIFEPFFTTKAEGKGTGLGLATAHGIIDAAGGTIECESAPGVGTTFRILLPTTAVISESPAAKSAPELGRAAHILLVEDRDDVRILMADALEEAGHQLADAHDEESALYAMREGRKFDLLCTDAVMPNTDTMAIIARFKETNPKAPILVCSGHVEEDLVRRGIETGRYRYLPKPFTPDELVEVVADTLARVR